MMKKVFLILTLCVYTLFYMGAEIQELGAIVQLVQGTQSSVVSWNSTDPLVEKQNSTLRTTKIENEEDHDTGERPAIVILTSKSDMMNLRRVVQSIDRHLNDNHSTPLLIFHEGNLNRTEVERLEKTTNRPVHWPHVSFRQFPEGFDPAVQSSNFRKRGKFAYQQMCRFWIYRIWQHEAIANYTSIMRLDTDSCFKATPPQLPYLNKKLVYKADAAFGNRNDPAWFTAGLWNVTLDFVQTHNITIKNPGLWETARESTVMTNGTGLPTIMNHFELDRIEFFRRPMVRLYHETVSEHPPFGIMKYRWGDAIVRFLTMAMFASPEEIDLRPVPGYGHGWYPCRKVKFTKL